MIEPTDQLVPTHNMKNQRKLQIYTAVFSAFGIVCIAALLIEPFRWIGAVIACALLLCMGILECGMGRPGARAESGVREVVSFSLTCPSRQLVVTDTYAMKSAKILVLNSPEATVEIECRSMEGSMEATSLVVQGDFGEGTEPLFTIVVDTGMILIGDADFFHSTPAAEIEHQAAKLFDLPKDSSPVVKLQMDGQDETCAVAVLNSKGDGSYEFTQQEDGAFSAISI